MEVCFPLAGYTGLEKDSLNLISSAFVFWISVLTLPSIENCMISHPA
jgi:hypothetical protein